jgi:hypothetical protein
MSKKQLRTSANAPTANDPASVLIATVSAGTTKADPSPEGLAALRKLVAHNDSQDAPTKKVGFTAAIAMLQKHYGWKGSSISALNSLCRRVLGRKSWGTP